MHPAELPSEILDQVFQEILYDRPTLIGCSLVCKRWCHHSRWVFFSFYSVVISSPTARIHRLHTLEPQHIAFENSTLTPYIQHLRIYGQLEQQETIQFIRHLTTRLVNLRKLTILYFDWKNPSTRESLSIFHGLPIHSLFCHYMTYRTVDELVEYLNAFPSLREYELLGSRVRGSRSSKTPQLSTKFSILRIINCMPELSPWTSSLLQQPCGLSKFTSIHHSAEDIQPAADLIAHVGPTLRDLTITIHHLENRRTG